ncbi:dephospho-CoA kinase [Sulfurimonas sp. MAG313]|nr:dephospho-CoA kinase [Sulfurimonas sp. MAG313]MDF1880805.1 dephospho-CoA kinase [Sulfurimonas sp. MAG313]
MSQKLYKYAIALTGGIATGKSTVASLMKLHGIAVIDADAITHELLDVHHKSIAEMFGDQFVRKNRVLRENLGKIIFTNEEKKKQLEAFIHPLIRDEIEIRSAKADAKEFPYLIDIPLFFENGAYDIKDSVVIYTPPSVQLERYMKRNKLNEDEAMIRINSQMSIDEKKSKATWVIDNSLKLKHLQNEVEAFVHRIKVETNYYNRFD